MSGRVLLKGKAPATVTPTEATRLVAKGKGKQPESLILKAVRDYLRAAGWTTIRIQQGMGAHKGIADLYCIRRGRHVWAEIKTATGTQSPFQIEFERQIKAEGGEYCVLRSVEDAAAMSGEQLLC